jgi:hypothetical protein
MALSGTVLGQLIKGNIDALSDEDKADRDKVFEEMGKAIVSHIQSSGTVATTVSTVTTCPAGAGTGAGSGTGTIT